jgi:hypothetical protein
MVGRAWGTDATGPLVLLRIASGCGSPISALALGFLRARSYRVERMK